MLRVLALAVLATALVAACGPAPSGLSPDDAYEAAQVAADSGEVHRALALLDEAADAGHLAALRTRADAMACGYLRTPAGYRRGETQQNLPFLTWPWDASRAEGRYKRVLRDSVRADRPGALYLALDDALGDSRFCQPPSDIDREAADALYRRLAQTEHGTFRLALTARKMGHQGDYERWFAEAAEREPQACYHRLLLSTARPPSETAEDRVATEAGFRSPHYYADFIDGAERCAGLPRAGRSAPPEDVAGRFVQSLRAEAASGNDDAAVILDGLRAEGVFRRHPRLAPGGAADA